MTVNHPIALLSALSIYLGLSGCELQRNQQAPSPASSAAPIVTKPIVTKTTPSAPAPASTKSGVTAQVKPTKPPLTLKKLKNTAYSVVADGPVTLKDGHYQDQKKRKFTLGPVVAYGDLNRDGVKDAVTTLDVEIGGRTFTYLMGVLNQAGTPKNVSSEFLGERVSVKVIDVNAGKINVKLDKYAPNDPACCPSQEISRGYTFQANRPKASQPKDTTPAKVPSKSGQPSPATP